MAENTTAPTRDNKYMQWATEHELLQGGPESFYDPGFWSALSNYLQNLKKEKPDVVHDNIYNGFGLYGRGMFATYENRQQVPTVAHMIQTQDVMGPFGEAAAFVLGVPESFLKAKKAAYQSKKAELEEQSMVNLIKGLKKKIIAEKVYRDIAGDYSNGPSPEEFLKIKNKEFAYSGSIPDAAIRTNLRKKLNQEIKDYFELP
jgi:hypothetical protein